MNNKYINFERGNYTLFQLMMLIFWTLFSFLSTFEGYFPDTFGELTRFILVFWVAVMFLQIGRDFTFVKIDQLLLLLWLVYYLISLIWTDNLEQAMIYIMSVTLMAGLCICVQYFKYGLGFIRFMDIIYKLGSISVALLSVFFYADIGAGTRRVLYLFNTYIDPNNQVAIIAIGSGLCLYGIFNFKTFKQQLFDIIGFIICCYSIFQTGSRSGVVVLIIQIMIIFIFWHPEQNSIFKEMVKWFGLIALGIVAFYFINNYISSDITDRLLGQGNLSFFDGTQREDRWAIGVEYFWRRPFIGNGWGSFECHNTFLTMLVDVGIIGNLCFYFILIRLYIKAYKKKEIIAIMILTSGLVPSFFIGAQNKRFFWTSIIIASILVYCKGESNDYNNNK